MTIWYWEYRLKIFNKIDSKEEICSGIVAADTITEAMREIESYYCDEIMEVQMLKPITNGVFDFHDVMEDADFDFIVISKKKV